MHDAPFHRQRGSGETPPVKIPGYHRVERQPGDSHKQLSVVDNRCAYRVWFSFTSHDGYKTSSVSVPHILPLPRCSLWSRSGPRPVKQTKPKAHTDTGTTG